eukprot:m.949733 g.949733  ORF g.949733 m.949733 type:complete len:564 (+) comp23857_c1_seq10:80-1771(+)
MTTVTFPQAGDVPPPSTLTMVLEPEVRGPLFMAADALKHVRDCTSKFTAGGDKSSSLMDCAIDADGCCATAVATALEKIDSAREATFPFLQSATNSQSYNDAYALTSLYWAECCVADAVLNTQNPDPGPDHHKKVSAQAAHALRAVDLAILRGGHDWAPVAKHVSLAAADLVQKFRQEHTKEPVPKRRRTEHEQQPKESVSVTESVNDIKARCRQWQEGVASRNVHDIQCVDAQNLSPLEFKEKFLSQGKPVVIRGGMHGWPALAGPRAWSNSAYLKDRAGDRLIPVEVCSKQDRSQTYLTDSWEREVMPLRDYIDAFVAAEVATADTHREDEQHDRQGYLAQYGLFEQIPELRHDLLVPEYCHMVLPSDGHATKSAPPRAAVGTAVSGQKTRNEPTDATDVATGSDASTSDSTVQNASAADDMSLSVTNRLTAENIQISAWFGPCDTVSPLHHDPYHNLLAQVVGYKYVRLYPKEESKKVYPRAGAMCNNSFINIDNVDTKKYPLFADIQAGYHCVLGPGDMLHIPRHMWHYVRSLSISFSVSFWWGACLPLVHDQAGLDTT